MFSQHYIVLYYYYIRNLSPSTWDTGTSTSNWKVLPSRTLVLISFYYQKRLKIQTWKLTNSTSFGIQRTQTHVHTTLGLWALTQPRLLKLRPVAYSSSWTLLATPPAVVTGHYDSSVVTPVLTVRVTVGSRLSWRPAASYHFSSARHRSSGTRLHTVYKYCWEILSLLQSCWCPHQYAINKWLIKLGEKNRLFYKHSKDKVSTSKSGVNGLHLNLNHVTLVYNLLNNMVIVQWSTGECIQFQEYDVLNNYM